MKDINQSKIKEINRKKIIGLLLEKEEVSKLEISRALDISITTVSTNINELRDQGIVEEVGQLESTGGRKAMAIKLIDNSRYSIGIALTPENIKIVLLNIKKQLIDEVNIKHSNNGIENIIVKVKENIEDILSKYHIESEKLLGIGISIPGTVDSETGIIKYCYLLNAKEFDIVSEFKYLNVPIYVDNEANLSAYYEFLNSKKNVEDLIYVSITDGLGVGIIIDGKIYRGGNNASGEMGHTKIAINGKQCKCGKCGCFEAYASKNALVDLYNELSEVKITSTDEFINEINNYNSSAETALNEYINTLGIGIANLMMLLDPNCIVLGGEINSLLITKFNDLKEVIYKENIFTDRYKYEVKVTKYKESYLIGSAMVPIEEYLKI